MFRTRPYFSLCVERKASVQVTNRLASAPGTPGADEVFLELLSAEFV